MRVFALSTLRFFWDGHADAEEALREWYKDAVKADWKAPNEVKEYATSVSLLSNDRVCFNIKGNTYRLIASINYKKRLVFVEWVGTHREYNKIDAETVEFRRG